MQGAMHLSSSWRATSFSTEVSEVSKLTGYAASVRARSAILSQRNAKKSPPLTPQMADAGQQGGGTHYTYHVPARGS